VGFPHLPIDVQVKGTMSMPPPIHMIYPQFTADVENRNGSVSFLSCKHFEINSYFLLFPSLGKDGVGLRLDRKERETP
jgi:hypothetical protein